MTRMPRRGATLLIVMVALVAVGTMAFAGRSAAAIAIRQVAHRQSDVRSQLTGEGCLVIWQARIEDALQRAPTPRAADSIWTTLPVHADTDPRCLLTRRPAGRAVDANTADTMLLLAALRDMAGGRGDALLDRLLDWRDDDDRPRPRGAERAQYRAAGAPGPANDWFWTDDEVLQALGDSAFASVFTRYVRVEAAPLWKDADNVFLSTATRAIATDTTPLPRAWYLEAAVRLRHDAPCVTVQWRVARNGTRLAVPDRRTITGRAHDAIPGEAVCR